MYHKHEMEFIKFDKNDAFTDTGFGSMEVLPDDDEDGDN